MSSDNLSGNEIDALLGSDSAAPEERAVAGGSDDLDAPDGEARLYDFRRPHRIPREKMRPLEAVYDRCTRGVEAWLLNRARGGVQLRLQSVEQLTLGEFTASLPTPCASFTFEVRDAGGCIGVVDFGHEFAYFLVDRLFGGGGAASIPNRSLTPIERMAVRLVADRVLASLQEAWQDYVQLTLDVVGFESIPEILRVASREEPVLVANIEVTIGETRSLFTICLPIAVIEPFLASDKVERVTTSGTPAELAQNREMAEHSIRGSRMWVSARLPEFRISMRELLALTNDSVLSTGLTRTVPLDVLVGNQRRFRASPGRVGASLAVRLTDGLMPAPDPDTIPLHRA